MNKKTQLLEIVKDELVFLPKEIQKVIAEHSWFEDVESICKRYGLTEEETYAVQKETLIMLMGLSVNLAEEIEYNVILTKKESIEIANEINNIVLTKTSDHLENEIKEKIVKKEPKWHQNIDFFLSNGNWFTFLEGEHSRNQMIDNKKTNQAETDISKIEKLKESFTI